MKLMISVVLTLAASLALQGADAHSSADVVVYGSSPAALTAAIEAQRHGKSAIVVCPERRIGGLTTGGLGQTDIGSKSAFGGLALEFYRDIAKWYSNPAHWTRQKPEEYFPEGQCAGTKDGGSMWTFEPSAALAVLEEWERRYGLDIRRGEWLDRERGVVKDGERIVSIKTLSSNVYFGKVFVDATYEGDLMAAAGVGYTVGREANSRYGETISGVQWREAKFHQLMPGVDPYVVKGRPESGLLPGIEPFNPDERDGDGDSRVQAYCFRMCLTDDPENRIPFKKPANYDEREYELLFRNYEGGQAKKGLPWINARMPNRKTDTNNRTGFSTDFIGRNWEWPEASYERRAEICRAHLEYQQGLMWTLANHPRIPAEVRERVSRWGTCKDEFPDGFGDGWQRQLYVREARRMVGEYVMTEHECRGDRKAPRPVAMGAYTMDSHNVRRAVTADGKVLNEGDVEDPCRYSAWGPDAHRRKDGGRMKPYGIDYGAIVPKRGECSNLIVPVCLSASHMAFGSIRMEPVFFALGQAAGAAASLAVDGGVAVQNVEYGALRQMLLDGGQVIPLPAQGTAWRPGVRWCGFNLLGMFCQTKMENGDRRIFGYFPEDRFQWMKEWGFNFARLPLDYRFFVEKGDWTKPVEAQLRKLDEAVQYGRRYGIHVQVNFHRAPGYCCNAPQEPKSLFLDPEPLAAFTNLWGVLARRYRGIPNEELSFDLVNEPAPIEFYGATPSNYAVVARAALAAIRAADPDRFVMSDGWKWGNEPVMELHPFDHASGESIHCYAPHRLTHYRVFDPNDARPCPPWPPAGCTNGVEWLERNFAKAWRPAIDDGTFLFVGEFGCYQGTVPHATYLAWMEDVLRMFQQHGWGWALWNLDGTFGVLDTPRTDCEFEDFHGHRLDRKALELLRRFRGQ